MPIPFSRMRELENQRVRMTFDDGTETVARLLSAVEDLDGSHHLIYDRIESCNDQNPLTDDGSAMYAEGESLCSLNLAEDPSGSKQEPVAHAHERIKP